MRGKGGVKIAVGLEVRLEANAVGLEANAAGLKENWAHMEGYLKGERPCLGLPPNLME
nr:hypothetical protein [Tanacetum cinerariifolium]